MDLNFIAKLVKKNQSKIVFLVMDGLGGLPQENGAKTELETAITPNLDKLASESICGLQLPVGSGLTPGSGPGHFSLFGYDPFTYQVGRGVLSALGVNFKLGAADVAARGNFCTVDNEGLIIDRRAGRISSEKGKELCDLLGKIKLPGVEVFVESEKEHRFVLVLRGPSLSGDVADTDPQATGVKPFEPATLKPEAEKTAGLVNSFLEQASVILKEHHPANMALLRGFAKHPSWPSMSEAYGLKSAAIAAYPMYRGLAKLLGMEVIETGTSIEEEIATAGKNWEQFDFFFIHIKGTDSSGEDGDFARKVSVIEELDRKIPLLLGLNPDVLVVTGDHSTPAAMRQHSWHPVPVLLHSKCCRPDMVREFKERACISGGLGPRIPAVELMPLALANALRLEKFGA